MGVVNVSDNLSGVCAFRLEMKFLGIHITETLKWNSHVQSLAN
jgi:hypothetical protein